MHRQPSVRRSSSDEYARQKLYYRRRADEYDAVAWEPQSAEEAAEIESVVRVLAELSPARTLDVACGTGFLTRHLHGEMTLLDASEEMLAIAASRVPRANVVHADALPLPFPDDTFER